MSSLNLNESSSINGVTFTFWIRPFAFVDKIFEYYEGYSVLKYNGDDINDKDTFGLSLIIGFQTIIILTYLKKSQKQSMFIKKVFDQIMNNVGEKYTNKKTNSL